MLGSGLAVVVAGGVGAGVDISQEKLWLFVGVLLGASPKHLPALGRGMGAPEGCCEPVLSGGGGGLQPLGSSPGSGG